MNNRFKVLYI